MANWKQSAAVLLCSAAALLTTACGGGGSTTTPPPVTTYVLTVNSVNPTSGVAITYTPADKSGATTGTSSFTRTFDAGTAVSLTAPASASGVAPSWSPCPGAAGKVCSVTMSANTTLTVQYPILTPTVTVTLFSPSITTAQALTVMVGVSGSATTPSGSVTLTGGGYTSAAATLSGGKATVAIAAGALAVGSDILTATYTPDAASSATYASATGQSSAVTVTGTVSTTPAITIDGSSIVAPISFRQVGINLGAWTGADVTSTSPSTLKEVQSVGTTFVRWPGGSYADVYHWAGPSPFLSPSAATNCNPTDTSTTPWIYAADPAYLPANDWTDYETSIGVEGEIETAVTLDFGTDAACTGGGSAAEAAAWVANAKSNNYAVKYWTVGNEEYGSWEADLHPYTPASKYGGTGGHWGSVYTAAMNGPTGYYQSIKAADPKAQVGAVIEIGGMDNGDGWNAAVLGCTTVSGPTSCSAVGTGAQFDFLEVHDYQQGPGSESDAYLLGPAIAQFDGVITTLRAELVATGHSANTPIYLGEFNSVYGNQGKQTMSIVNALYIGLMYGEVLNQHVDMATLWFGLGGDEGCGNNNSSSLYGWQNFGGYDTIATQTANGWNNCGAGPVIPEGTVLPNGRAVSLLNQFAVDGSNLLATTVDGTLPNVRAYAANKGTGYTVLLINLDKNNAANATIGLSNGVSGSYTATATTYGKAQYDDSKNNVWTGPVTQSLGNVGPTMSVSLPAWSMTVVQLK